MSVQHVNKGNVNGNLFTFGVGIGSDNNEIMFTMAFKSYNCEKLSNYFDFSLLKLNDFILSLSDRNLTQQI